MKTNDLAIQSERVHLYLPQPRPAYYLGYPVPARGVFDLAENMLRRFGTDWLAAD